jgi:hypothetical protein
MSTRETHGNVSEIARAAALECAKSGVTFILPWRMDAGQDHLHKGIDQCGCAFAPEDDQERI